MDANMQQIMMEAEHQYNSRVAAHLQSQFQPPSGSPHLDSIVYYELPDTPRKRKKIFDPRYKYAQHNRHLTRLQSNEPLRAASIDFQQRAAGLNHSPVDLLHAQSQQPKFVSAILSGNSEAIQNHIAGTVAHIQADQQTANLFAAALQQSQPLHSLPQPLAPTFNPLQAHPQQNRVAEAFMMNNMNNQQQMPVDQLIGITGSLMANDIARQQQSSALPGINLSSLQRIPLPINALPSNQGNIPIEALLSAAHTDLSNQSDLNLEMEAVRTDLATRNLLQEAGHAVTSQIARKGMMSSVGKAIQTDIGIKEHLEARRAPIMMPTTHLPTPMQNLVGFGPAFETNVQTFQSAQTLPASVINTPTKTSAQQVPLNIVGAALSQDIRLSRQRSITPPIAPIPQPPQALKGSLIRHSTAQLPPPPVTHMVTSLTSQRQTAEVHPHPSIPLNQQPGRPPSKPFETAIRRQEHSDHLMVNQPSTTFHENNVFNFMSMNQGQVPSSLPSELSNQTQKDPQLTANMAQKISQIQMQIDKLSTQLKETELKDSIRQERLQSVLSAKQKEVSRREAQMKKSEMLLLQLKEEKNSRAAHIESLKLEVERLRRQNQLRSRSPLSKRAELFGSFGQTTSAKDYVGRSDLPADGLRSDYSWASDRLVNSSAKCGRLRTEGPLTRERPMGDLYRPRSRSPSPETYSIIEKVSPMVHHNPMTFSVPENLFSAALQTSNNQVIRVPVTPIVAQAPIKTLTTITPASNYKALETFVVPPVVIAPNVAPLSKTTVFEEKPGLLVNARVSTTEHSPSFIKVPPPFNPPTAIRGSFGPIIQQQPILVQDHDNPR